MDFECVVCQDSGMMYGCEDIYIPCLECERGQEKWGEGKAKEKEKKTKTKTKEKKTNKTKEKETMTKEKKKEKDFNADLLKAVKKNPYSRSIYWLCLDDEHIEEALCLLCSHNVIGIGDRAYRLDYQVSDKAGCYAICVHCLDALDKKFGTFYNGDFVLSRIDDVCDVSASQLQVIGYYASLNLKKIRKLIYGGVSK